MSTEAESRFFLPQPDHTPAMLRFIEQYQEEYAALLFMNFYFSQTVLGSVIAPQKTILIPLVHPDKNLYWALNAPMFTRVRPSPSTPKPNGTPPAGSSARRWPRTVLSAAASSRRRPPTGIRSGPLPSSGRSVVYLGRVTPSKLNDLIPCFLDYCRRYGSDTKLVLTGGIDPQAGEETHPEILRTGFVSDAEKAAIIRHATVMVNPSHLESLSLLMLEAMNSRIPVLVNGRSRVMKEHCRLSGAALWYDNEREFLPTPPPAAHRRSVSHGLGSRGPGLRPGALRLGAHHPRTAASDRGDLTASRADCPSSPPCRQKQRRDIPPGRSRRFFHANAGSEGMHGPHEELAVLLDLDDIGRLDVHVRRIGIALVGLRRGEVVYQTVHPLAAGRL